MIFRYLGKQKLHRETYAKWISEALSCQLLEQKNVHTKNLEQADIIIYGGGLYAGGVSGIKLLTQNWKAISDKHVILFTCGLADPKNPDNVKHIREELAKALPEEMLSKITLFHLQGGIDYSRLSFVHKTMMAMLRKVMLKKDPSTLSKEDHQLLDTYGKQVDMTDHDSIKPLVDYASSL